MTTRIHFQREWGSCNGNEVAGFPDAQAAALVASGVATIADAPAPQAVPASARPAARPCRGRGGRRRGRHFRHQPREPQRRRHARRHRPRFLQGPEPMILDPIAPFRIADIPATAPRAPPSSASRSSESPPVRSASWSTPVAGWWSASWPGSAGTAGSGKTRRPPSRQPRPSSPQHPS